MLSKTLAEAAAWKFSKENGIDMVTIHPGWVLGPLLQPTLNLSVEEIIKLTNGTLQQLTRIFNVLYFSIRISVHAPISRLNHFHSTALQMARSINQEKHGV